MFAAQVGPKQAVSHTADWIEVFVRVPAWLRTAETDRVVRNISSLILLVCGSLVAFQYFDTAAMPFTSKLLLWIAFAAAIVAIVFNLARPAWLESIQPSVLMTIFGALLVVGGAIWQWQQPTDPRMAELLARVDQQAKEIEGLKKQGMTTVPAIPPAASNITPPGELALVAPAEREFTNRTPRQLLALYEGRTPFQADKLIDPFKGLWIEAQSRVLTILPGGAGPVIVLRDDRDTIECRFDPKWNNAVARLDIGDPLRVRGKISPNQNGQQLYLLECEIAPPVRGDTEPTGNRVVSISDPLQHFIQGRQRFTIAEAACLLAQTDIRQEGLVGPASGYLYDIKNRILEGTLKALNERHSEIAMQRALGGLGGSEKELRNSLEISKDDLATLAAALSVDIPGISSPSSKKKPEA